MASTRRPIPPREDAESDHERSSVRPKLEPRSVRPGSGSFPAAPTSERLARLEATANALRAGLPEGHPSLRLLDVALMRRDETLLAAIVASLSSGDER